MDFLVIDDDKTFRDATCLLIDSEGHYAEAACSGELGLAELKEGKFGAVLLDLNLGAEKGLDILEQILKRQPNLPVIIFTAQGSVKNAVEAMRRGAGGFPRKAVHPRTVSFWCSPVCSAFTSSTRTSNGWNGKSRGQQRAES